MPRTRILLAENEPNYRQLLEQAIREGCPSVELTLVQSRTELLQVIEHSDFDSMVVDFNLPDAQADELLPTLAENGCHSPVVIVSTDREQDIVIRSLRSGGVDFVPMDEAIQGTLLWQRIQAAIEHRQKQRLIKRRVRRLARLAETDPLTGLANRFGLDQLLNGRRQRLDRRGHACLAMMDIDFFKHVNDTWGHLCGDRALQAVASRLRASVKPHCLVYRWGGEEFLVIMPDTQLGAAWIWSEQVRQAIETMRIDWSNNSIALTISIGVAQCLSDETWDDILSRTDDALRFAKQQGRNRVCSWAMVVLERLVGNRELRSLDDPREQMQTLVTQAGDILGPTQRDHLLRHGARVADLAVAIGRHLRLEGPELEEIRRAGLFHDLGKFIVPEDILAKRGPLSEGEQLCCRQHVDYGASVGERSQLLTPGILGHWIRHHHARFDHDSGHRPPLGARIIALADAYDAMTSWRPYAPCRSVTNAMDELKHERGRQFDPRVVDVAIAVLQSGTNPPAQEVLTVSGESWNE